VANEQTIDQIISFLGAPEWEIWRSISENDTLRGTLHVNGGRGHSILKAFGKKFGVEMSGYSRRRYFTSYPEVVTSGPFPPEFTWLLRFVNPSFRDAWDRAVYYEISVEHLANVVEAGKWFDPEPIPFPDRPRLSSPRFDQFAIITLNVLLIPYRLLSLAFGAFLLWMLGVALWMMPELITRYGWPAIFGLAFPLFLPAGTAMKTAAIIQERLGGDPSPAQKRGARGMPT
jgi:hypothetical protein